MMRLHVQLFGLPQIFIDGNSVHIRRRKTLALLVYLLMRQSPATRVHLSTFLWNTISESNTNAYLRLLIHDLKQTLGNDGLSVNEVSVALATDTEIWLDTRHFSYLVHESLPTTLKGRIAILKEAIALYGDDFLAGFSLPDAQSFEGWQFLQRERFRELLVQAYQELVEAYLTVGELAKGLEIAQGWLVYDPLSEAAYSALMQLHYRAGRRSLALRYYERLYAMLEREFSLTPMPRTQALYKLIQRADDQVIANYGALDSLLLQKLNQPDSSFPRHELLSDEQLHRLYEIYPNLQSIHIEISAEKVDIRLQTLEEVRASEPNILPLPAPFVGRKRELSEIRELICAPENRLVTLIGLGGIGKTRLAQELAVSLDDLFVDGVSFVALENVQSEDDIFYAIAESLALDVPQKREAARQLVLRVLKDTQYLLILDNFEHLVVHCGFVRHLLQETAKVNILITSRERLNIEEELIYPLRGLHHPDKDSSDSLSDYESVRLFTERLRLVRPMKAITEAELRDIAVICRLVHGVPLGIVIAAAWGGILQLAEIHLEVQRSLDFLQTQQRDIPIRQRSIRAVFDTSWALLTEAERDMLLRLSVFRGGFKQQAAAAVSNASLHTLTSIVNKSLLIHDELSGHYSLHPLIHQFAEARLNEDNGEIFIRRAHCQYYLSQLAEFDGRNVHNEQDIMLDTVSMELENIRASWHFAVKDRDFDAIADAIGVMSHYHAIRGLWSEGFSLFEAARQGLAPRNNEKAHPTWGRLLAHHYGIAQHYGGVDKRLARLQLGLDIVQEAGLEFATAHALSEIGVAYILAGRYGEAIPFIQRVVTYHEKKQLERSVAYSYWYLALSYASTGNYEQAKQYNEKSYILKQQFGDHRGMTDCLNMSASLAFAQGYFAKMQEFLQEARDLSLNIENRMSVMFNSLALGFHALLLGKFSEAGDFAFDVMQIADELPNVEGQTAGQALLGVLAHLQGTDDAENYMKAAWLVLQEQPPERSTESINLNMNFLSNWALVFLALTYDNRVILDYCLPEMIQFVLRTRSLGALMMCLPIMAAHLSDKDDEQANKFLALSNAVPEIGIWANDWSVFQTLRGEKLLPKFDILTVDLLVDVFGAIGRDLSQD